MTILMGVIAVLSFVHMFTSVAAIVPGLLKFLLYGYLFIVMYSLYSKFQDEFDRGHIIQYHAPIEKV